MKVRKNKDNVRKSSGAFWGVTLGALLYALCLIPARAAVAGGDEIEMKDGSVIHGDIVARNSAEYYVSTKGGLVRVDAAKISEIHFGPVVKKMEEPGHVSKPNS